MQIIVFALTMGLISFLGIVCFLTWGGMRGDLASVPLLTLIGLVLAGVLTVARGIVLQVMVATARRDIRRGMPDAGRGKSSAELADDAADQLVGFYQTRMIVGAALLEGAAFFLLTVLLLERSPWSLIAAVVMILGVAAHFPTQRSVAEWVEQQTSRMEEERQVDG